MAIEVIEVAHPSGLAAAVSLNLDAASLSKRGKLGGVVCGPSATEHVAARTSRPSALDDGCHS